MQSPGTGYTSEKVNFLCNFIPTNGDTHGSMIDLQKVHILTVHHPMRLDYAKTHEAVTTVKVTDTTITSESFLVPLCFLGLCCVVLCCKNA